MSIVSYLPDRFRGVGEQAASSLAFWVGLGFFAVYSLAALMGQMQLMMVMALGIMACIAVVCLRMPVLCCTLWLLVAGSTPEIWMADVVAGSQNMSTAMVKLSEIGLVAICMLRFGPVLDLFNPAFAYVLMFGIGLGHGLSPELTVGESLRSVFGASTPFAFSFTRLSRRWSECIIEATIWVPTLCLVFGLVLAAAGIREFLVPDEGGSVRLGGSTHPAFLGSYAMVAAYAALVELYRNGRNRYLYLLIWNLLILFGSGARAPLASAAIVVGFAFFAIRSNSFTVRKRILPLIFGLLSLPILLAVAATSNSIRLLTVLSGNAEGLSGRDVIWPFFEAAFAQSPIFGWGVGAGKELVDPDSLTAHILGTTAAHNEYLRIGVDGGYVGIALVMGYMSLWTWYWSRALFRSDRIIARLLMFAFALQSITDNTLIAATATVLFAWMSAIFARGRIESEERAAVAVSDQAPTLDIVPGHA